MAIMILTLQGKYPHRDRPVAVKTHHGVGLGETIFNIGNIRDQQLGSIGMAAQHKVGKVLTAVCLALGAHQHIAILSPDHSRRQVDG